MARRGYTVLGWVVWQVATRVAKRKLQQNRVKLAAVAAVAVATALLVALRSGGRSE